MSSYYAYECEDCGLRFRTLKRFQRHLDGNEECEFDFGTAVAVREGDLA